MIQHLINKFNVLSALFLLGFALPAQAMTLDWSGYFRADHNYIDNYQMNVAAPGYSNSGEGGEYVPGAGKKSATFSTFFMKLKPRVLVNDNVIIRSEWNVGDPVYGLFGRGVPNEDRNNGFSTGKRGLDLSVSRLWLDTHTEFGTLQVGRAPMHWGLGTIFNSGDNPFDRYQSTSDTIRLISKFGYLSLMPIFAKNATGRNTAGSSNPLNDAVNTSDGKSDDVTDYAIALKFENPEEDLDAGLMYYKRNASDSQTNYYYPGSATTYTAGANGMNLKLLDFYARKTWNRFTLAGEIPIYSGEVPDINGAGSRNTYQATALAAEATLKYDTWKHNLKFGTVPGQGPMPTGARGKTFGAMTFHRAYKLGLIMFNYNFWNFGGTNPDPIPCAGAVTAPCSGNAPASAVSPWDNAITNAKYVMFASEKRWEQWGINMGIVWGYANESAVSGKDAYNHRTKQWFTSNASQSKSLGFEIDLGTRYNWDENISFGGDFGLFYPGGFYKYYNSHREGPANHVTAISLNAATVF